MKKMTKAPLSLMALAVLVACGGGDVGLSRAEVEEIVREELADSLGFGYLFTEWPVFYLSVFARTQEVNVPKTIVKREGSST